MKKLKITILLVAILIANSTFSQNVTIKEKGTMSFRLVYGNDQLKENDFKTSLGGDVFPYESIIIYCDWWTLLGELIYDTGIKWKLKDKFSFSYENKSYEIDRTKISKYPDLIKRLDAAGPINKWNMSLCLQGGNIELKKFDVTLKISDNDIVASWKNNEISYRVPGSPKKYKDRIDIYEKDGLGLSENETKALWSQLISFQYNDAKTSLLNGWVNKGYIQNSYSTWVEIVNTYEKYEKEGYNTISDQIEAERENDLSRYAKDDEWSIPCEDNSAELQIEYSKDDQTFIVKKGQRIVKMLPQGKYTSISKLNGTDKWEARLKHADSYNNNIQILNSKGDPLTFNGCTSFCMVNKSASQLELIQRTSDEIFNEKSDTRNLQYGFFESSFSAINNYNNAKQEYKDYWARKSSSSSSGGMTIAMSPRTVIVFNVKVVTVDGKFNVMHSKTGAYLQ